MFSKIVKQRERLREHRKREKKKKKKNSEAFVLILHKKKSGSKPSIYTLSSTSNPIITHTNNPNKYGIDPRKAVD